MSSVSSGIDSSDTSLSDRMDEWISRQHTLLVVAQESQLQSDQHKVVENDADITDYPINSYVLYTPPMGRSNKLLPKLKDGSSPYTSLKISPRQADQDSCSQSATLPFQSSASQSYRSSSAERARIHGQRYHSASR